MLFRSLITDGEHSSEIHTGPGRNRVISGEGRDQIHVGPGENEVTGGPGGVTYHVAWGGVLVITDWHADDHIRLVNWPMFPEVSVESDRICLSLGLSFIELQGIADLALIGDRVQLA